MGQSFISVPVFCKGICCCCSLAQHTWKWTKVECTERQFRENSYKQASVFVHFAS